MRFLVICGLLLIGIISIYCGERTNFYSMNRGYLFEDGNYCDLYNVMSYALSLYLYFMMTVVAVYLDNYYRSCFYINEPIGKRNVVFKAITEVVGFFTITLVLNIVLVIFFQTYSLYHCGSMLQLPPVVILRMIFLWSGRVLVAGILPIYILALLTHRGWLSLITVGSGHLVMKFVVGTLYSRIKIDKIFAEFMMTLLYCEDVFCTNLIPGELIHVTSYNYVNTMGLEIDVFFAEVLFIIKMLAYIGVLIWASQRRTVK